MDPASAPSKAPSPPSTATLVAPDVPTALTAGCNNPGAEAARRPETSDIAPGHGVRDIFRLGGGRALRGERNDVSTRAADDDPAAQRRHRNRRIYRPRRTREHRITHRENKLGSEETSGLRASPSDRGRQQDERAARSHGWLDQGEYAARQQAEPGGDDHGDDMPPQDPRGSTQIQCLIAHPASVCRCAGDRHLPGHRRAGPPQPAFPTSPPGSERPESTSIGAHHGPQ